MKTTEALKQAQFKSQKWQLSDRLRERPLLGRVTARVSAEHVDKTEFFGLAQGKGELLWTQW